MASITAYVNGIVQELTTSNLSAFYEYILYNYAAGNYTGTITVGNTNPIGTFTDTVRQGDVGSTDITILSNTYTLSQLTTATLTSTPISPHIVGLDVSQTPNIILQANLTPVSEIADNILQHRTVHRTAGYHLGNTAPSDGGTWTSLGQLDDTLYNFTIQNTVYFLWKKLSGNTTTLFRPLKIDNNTLVEFNDTDIQGILKEVEQRIIDTGIGTYLLQSTTPTPGTWASRGTITDIRRTVQDDLYTGVTPVSYTNDSLSYGGDYYNISYDGAASYEGIIDSNYIGGEVYTTNEYTGGGGYYTGSTFYDTTVYYLSDDALAYQVDSFYENTAVLEYYTNDAIETGYAVSTYFQGSVAREIGFGSPSQGQYNQDPGWTRFRPGPAGRRYTGPTYTRTFTGPIFFYLGLRFFTTNFLGTAYYAGPTQYTNEFYVSTTSYLGESFFSYYSIYTGSGGYEGTVSYSIFTSFGSEDVYTGNDTIYIGADDTIAYTSTIQDYYTGGDFYTNYYTGPTSQYGIISFYTQEFTSEYTIQTVSTTTETISTLTLYERIA